MHFSCGINRPPFERDSIFLQVTSGCSHACCSYCGFFKGSEFRKSPIDEISDDIKELASKNIGGERIFLQGADSFAADYDTLMLTAELIHRYLPNIKSIGGYAHINNFAEKTIDQIKNMVAMGYANPYLGVESGDDFILKRINKGYNAALARATLLKLTEAGMPIIVHYLNGIAPKDYGLDHAIKTCNMFDGINIDLIAVSSLTIMEETPIARQIEVGNFGVMPEKDRLNEMICFLQNLRNSTNLFAHRSTPFQCYVKLPDEKEYLINKIKFILDNKSEADLCEWRKHVRLITK